MQSVRLLEPWQRGLAYLACLDAGGYWVNLAPEPVTHSPCRNLLVAGMQQLGDRGLCFSHTMPALQPHSGG